MERIPTAAPAIRYRGAIYWPSGMIAHGVRQAGDVSAGRAKIMSVLVDRIQRLRGFDPPDRDVARVRLECRKVRVTHQAGVQLRPDAEDAQPRFGVGALACRKWLR